MPIDETKLAMVPKYNPENKVPSMKAQTIEFSIPKQITKKIMVNVARNSDPNKLDSSMRRTYHFLGIIIRHFLEFENITSSNKKEDLANPLLFTKS